MKRPIQLSSFVALLVLLVVPAYSQEATRDIATQSQRRDSSPWIILHAAFADLNPVANFYNRYAPPEFWNWGRWYPGNGDLTIYDGTDTQAPEDCIIWDIQGGGVHEGQASRTNPPIFTVSGPEIFGPDGTILYVATLEGGGLFKLRNETGAVELTLWGPFVFDIDLDRIPPFWSRSFYRLVREHLVTTIVGDRLYSGVPKKRNLVGTSTEQLTFSNPMRKLVLGALVSGCGSNGPSDPGGR